MAGQSFHLVNVWSDPEAGAGGYNPMAASLLWLPEGHAPGHPVPAFVYVHKWGGYPYDSLPSALGPQLAQQGFACLSLCLRRRGMEGQLTAMSVNDDHDIKLALDYLHTNGFKRLFLVGEELGCVSALNYASKYRDSRVAGVALLNPVAAPSDWLRATAGEERYAASLELAGTAARQGAGMDVRIDILSAGNGPTITQHAVSFLNWWSPGVFRFDRMLESVNTPLLLAAATGAAVPPELSAKGKLQQMDPAAEPAVTASMLVEFAQASGGELLAPVPLEMVRTESAGQDLFALFWAPADGQPTRTAVLLMPGLTSSPLSPLFCKLAPVLAQTGTAVLAVEVRRSGWAGHESALLDFDAEDLDVWVAELLARGYEKIVLAGASIGSISVCRYQSVRQHPNVVAIAHLMPTADCPKWFRQGVGAAPYAAAAEQARAAVAQGRGGSELIDIDMRQPPPNKYAGRFRWTQRADSWLSWWGPDADSVNSTHIANSHVPLLLLSGTEDSYNDAARFAELTAAAVNAPSVDEIWYPGIDHGLAGVEEQVARDLFSWLQKIAVL
jgi:alpha-beta hydrolase superfamily lysophospholipase